MTSSATPMTVIQGAMYTLAVISRNLPGFVGSVAGCRAVVFGNPFGVVMVIQRPYPGYRRRRQCEVVLPDCRYMRSGIGV